jgi:DNA-binding response OmpR family regulator
MKHKILLVEGDPVLQQSYSAQLAADGHDVTTAEDGLGALEKIVADSVDLVVLDLVLADGSGLDYINRFLKVKPNLMVVINSDSPSFKSDFRSWVADAFVTKSKDMTELKCTINKMLHCSQD